MNISANIVDISNRQIYYGELIIENGKIKSIERKEGQSDLFLLPGFVDAHVHIESSMLVPSEFARMAVTHGTVATVSDPHEIANVMGIEGVYFMIKNGNKVPLKFNFGAPSCVPATNFETAGAVIGIEGIEEMMQNPAIKYLAEMMNYPGVLFEDEEVMSKIEMAKKYGKPIDGHAPGLMGEDAEKYISAGISTDHECFTYEEALGKLELGMKILIREGSAAKNFEALIDLLPKYADRMMFCSDDKHPDDLIEGHINQLVARAVAKGYDIFDVLQAACINPVEHYNLDVGQLKIGDAADFILVHDLETFKVNATYINGELVAENGKSLIQSVETEIINNFFLDKKSPIDFQLESKSDLIQVIKAIDGEIVTESFTAQAKLENGLAISDLENDNLKMAVVNRYENQKPSVAFINNFNLKKGAIASCVGHDSHNIIAVGTDDDSLCRAVNLIIENQGGISAVSEEEEKVLSLPIAGIMTNADGYETAKAYSEIDFFVKNNLGCTLTSPFMTLSFMALLVIPQLKLSDKGLFDAKEFKFIQVFI
ncbi:MAG: adenine deaminase [Saprospiraceae bacterium]|nr:adenine deaminase [Saprospiraceae bacterium]MDG2419346.1 adenine deaminase [Saprospiraceae bacterium]